MTATINQPEVGRARLRKEDARLVTGQTRWTDNLNLPGMVMAAISLLEENPNPTDGDVRMGLEGNLCRCTGYQNIVNAVLAAAGGGA